MSLQDLLERLQARGFDNAEIIEDEESEWVRVSCSQCAACTINGVACHELSCPNDREEQEQEEPDFDDPCEEEEV